MAETLILCLVLANAVHCSIVYIVPSDCFGLDFSYSTSKKSVMCRLHCCCLDAKKKLLIIKIEMKKVTRIFCPLTRNCPCELMIIKVSLLGHA